jgi:hypothetical protein
MARRFVLAPEVEELLGPRGVEQLAATEMFMCSCGERARTDDEPVSVYVEMDQAPGGPPMYRVGLAHARCRASDIVRRPGLVEQLLVAATHERGDDARAFFVVRHRKPRALLIWSPYMRATMMPTRARGRVDTWLAAHLDAGFRPLRAPLLEAELPALEGWSLLVTAGELRLNDPLRGVAYQQERDPELEPWVEVAIADGSCLALTGTGLAGVLERGELAALEEAGRGERLVGGVVRVEAG